MRTRSGFGLIELLVAMAILGGVFSIVAFFLAQQSRATALSQATNDAELTTRTIAEAVAQDIQMAGARATFIAGTVKYKDIHDDCAERRRRGCVQAMHVDESGAISAVEPLAHPDDYATVTPPDGYTIWYRTSLDPANSCRRVDIAFRGDRVYRADQTCDAPASMDFGSSLFATDVSEFDIAFECTNGVSYAFPGACYAVSEDDYVQQARISLTVVRGGRAPIESSMALTAYAANLRPSVDYSRTE